MSTVADTVDRLKHALTLSTLDGTVRVRADDVIAMLRQAGNTDALRRVAHQIEAARDSAERKGEGHQREAFDEALDYVLDELRSEPTWSERHAPTLDDLAQVRRIDVTVDQPTVHALHTRMETERVSLTEAVRRAVTHIEPTPDPDPVQTRLLRQVRHLGKSYGRASATIAQLRGEVARLREQLRPARGRSLAGPTHETAADYDLAARLVPGAAQVACVGNSGRIHAIGKVVGYFDHPTFLLELADGTLKSWSARLVRELEPVGPRRLAEGEDDAEVWIPPRTDCMNHRHDPPCPHCGSTVFHHRTGRCGACGRRPGTARRDESGTGPHATLNGDRLHCVHGVTKPGTNTSTRCSWSVALLRRDPIELWAAHGAAAHDVHGALRWDETERSVVGDSPATPSVTDLRGHGESGPAGEQR